MTLVRPESGLYVAAVGVLVLVTSPGDWGQSPATRSRGQSRIASLAMAETGLERHRASAGFLVALAPWTISNAMVFQDVPAAEPAHRCRCPASSSRGDTPLAALVDRSSALRRAGALRRRPRSDQRSTQMPDRAVRLAGRTRRGGLAASGTTARRAGRRRGREGHVPPVGHDAGDRRGVRRDRARTRRTPSASATTSCCRSSAPSCCGSIRTRTTTRLAVILFPWAASIADRNQQFWLPLFVGLTWLWTLAGWLGALALWRASDSRNGSCSSRW